METAKPEDARNRRTTKRKIPRGSVKVECRRGSYGLGKDLVTQFLDVSEGGVRIVVSEELAAKSEVEVLIHSVNLKKPIKRMAKVCWSVPMENGNFCIGLEFDKRLLYGDASQFGKS